MAKTTNYEELSEKKLLALAEKRNVEVTESTTAEQIIEALKAQDEQAKADNGSAIFYWLKTNVYEDENKEVPVGLYKYAQPVARFDRLPVSLVEKFEDEIEYKHLVRIAQFFGIKPEEHEEDELLHVLLK